MAGAQAGAAKDQRFQNAENAALQRVPGTIDSGRLHRGQSGREYYTFVITESGGTRKSVLVDAESAQVRSVKAATANTHNRTRSNSRPKSSPSNGQSQ